MSHPTCCCSASLDRCDRCDLLVGLEGFHLMSVTRIPDALVLDVESCNQLVGCPGCGLNRSRPRARGGGGDRRARGRGPGADPVAQATLDMPRTHLPDRDFHRAEPLGVRPQGAFGCSGDPLGDPTVVFFEGATISGLARQLGTTWNTVWSHIKPCLQAAFENPARFAVIRVLVRDVFHEDTPAQGRRLATCLVARLPMCPIPAIARLGRTLCNWKDLLDAYFDIGGASNVPHRSHRRNH